jgi:hypothetical protein
VRCLDRRQLCGLSRLIVAANASSSSRQLPLPDRFPQDPEVAPRRNGRGRQFPVIQRHDRSHLAPSGRTVAAPVSPWCRQRWYRRKKPAFCPSGLERSQGCHFRCRSAGHFSQTPNDIVTVLPNTTTGAAQRRDPVAARAARSWSSAAARRCDRYAGASAGSRSPRPRLGRSRPGRFVRPEPFRGGFFVRSLACQNALALCAAIISTSAGASN